MILFSKPSIDVKNTNNYINSNKSSLMEQLRIDELYKKQPKRKKCKICQSKLDNCETVFERNGIKYVICKNCGHFLGEFEEDESFNKNIYSTSNENKEYAQKFINENKQKWALRVKNIYLPKADFLLKSLLECHKSTPPPQLPCELKITDIGCGSGHLLDALFKVGFENVEGYEVSKTQVDFANKQLNRKCCKVYNSENTLDLISNIDSDVISLIGVLEHLTNPYLFLNAIKNNKKIKYLFISVPLLSLCVIFQAYFSGIYERHLGAAHTHLFTQDSINWFCEHFGFKIVSEWWFGTDFTDLERQSYIKLNNNTALCNKYLSPYIDELQNILDKNKVCSEVHMLIKT